MQEYSDDFRIVRHYIWYNFVAQNAPITRESLTLEDVVAFINDIGEDWREKSKRGYNKIPSWKEEWGERGNNG